MKRTFPKQFLCNIRFAMTGRGNLAITKNHVKLRAKKRYGIWINREDMRDISYAIRIGQCDYIGPCSRPHLHKYLTRCRGIDMAVVYSKNKGLVTCLPRSEVRRYKTSIAQHTNQGVKHEARH